MKTAIITGISGSERIQYLEEIQEYAKRNGRALKIINMWDVLNEVSPKSIDEATILNIPTPKRMGLFKKAYKEAAHRLEELRQHYGHGTEKCVAVATHACFYWQTTYHKAFPNHLLRSLRADVFVTIIHNMRNIKDKLGKNVSHRFSDINFTDILHWRDRESTETRNWAHSFGKEHFVIARNEPPQTLYKILFEEGTKRVYFSYAMSYVRAQQLEARKLIDKLRERGYIVFDPGSIDDAKYVDKLLAGDPDNPVYQDLGKDVDDQTVKLDYSLVEQSQLLIARYPAGKLLSYKSHLDRMYIPLSAGVICEMVHGHSEGKRVYAVWLPKTEPSPFFSYHCRECFRSEQELLDYLARYEPPLS